MPYEVVEVQPTPNPNAKKFVLDGLISEKPISFLEPSSAGEHPLAKRLFAIEGVSSILLLRDFVTVSKNPSSNWPEITSQVKKVLTST